MRRKILKDNFNVNDNYSPVKGVVVMKTEDGRVIFKKNNLVVGGGRKFLLNLFSEKLGIKASELAASYSVSIRYGDGTAAVTSTDEALAGGTTKILTNNTENKNGNYVTVTMDEDNIALKFTVVLTGSGDTAINMSELGIVISSDNFKNNESLFSRIVFDPLPLTSNNKYTLEYYLYF